MSFKEDPSSVHEPVVDLEVKGTHAFKVTRSTAKSFHQSGLVLVELSAKVDIVEFLLHE